MKSLSGKFAIIISATGLILSIYADGWGADWKFIGKDDEGSVWEIDVASISRQPNNIVRVWGKITNSKKSVTDWVKKFGEKYKDFSHSMVLREYHCTEKEVRMLSLAHYSLDGGVILSDDSPGKWIFIVPDSIGEAIFKVVCEQPK